MTLVPLRLRRPITDLALPAPPLVQLRGATGQASGSGTQGEPEAATMKLTMPWRRTNRATCIATVVIAAVVAASAANAESRRVEVGPLTCSLSSSIGLVIGSQRNVSCLFRGAPGEPDEPYTGTMTKVGLDLGLTTGSVIIWTVFADTSGYKGMLIAAGLGAKVLVAGSNRTLALQPLIRPGTDWTRH